MATIKEHVPIRITIPAAVAGNLTLLQNGIASLMRHLGCGACCSGVDVTYLTAQEYILTENLEVHAHSTAVASGKLHTFQLTKSASYDIGKVKEAIASIAGKLGHPACCSGFNFRLQDEVEQLT